MILFVQTHLLSINKDKYFIETLAGLLNSAK
jgi:hypothetical protein